MKTWDQFWKEYNTSKAESYYILSRDKIIRNAAKTLNGERIKILEAGCGFGSNSRLLNRDKRFEVYCIDLSKEAVDLVKKEIPRAYIGDIEKMPFKDETFDIVFSSGVIEHFKDDSKAVSELYRVTKKNGIIITFVPGRYSLWQLYKIIKGKNWVHGYEKNYTISMLKKSFLKHKVKILNHGGIDPFSLNGMALKLFRFKLLSNISFSSAYGEVYLSVMKL